MSPISSRRIVKGTGADVSPSASAFIRLVSVRMELEIFRTTEMHRMSTVDMIRSVAPE
ncbi:hypothetical protein D3C80_2025320 [compost metagenome]